VEVQSKQSDLQSTSGPHILLKFLINFIRKAFVTRN